MALNKRTGKLEFLNTLQWLSHTLHTHKQTQHMAILFRSIRYISPFFICSRCRVLFIVFWSEYFISFAVYSLPLFSILSIFVFIYIFFYRRCCCSCWAASALQYITNIYISISIFYTRTFVGHRYLLLWPSSARFRWPHSLMGSWDEFEQFRLKNYSFYKIHTCLVTVMVVDGDDFVRQPAKIHSMCLEWDEILGKKNCCG